LARRILRALLADAVAIVRAFHPMVVCFAGVLAGAALVFDVFYLTAGTGVALAALYTVPLLAGLTACLIAAAEELGLERPVVSRTVAATVVVGLTNIAVVATAATMRRTGPSDWRYGLEAILFSAVSVLCFALTAVVMGTLAHSLGIELKTRFPERKPVPAPAPPPKAAIRIQQERVEPRQKVEKAPGRDRSEPLAPRVVDLDEPRLVVSSAGGTAHGDRRALGARRDPAASPSRRGRPGRRPGSGRR
jgi:uncharacterized membrane protein